MTKKHLPSLFVILMNLAVLLLSSFASAQTGSKPWMVYRQKGQCSISRQDWLSIAQDPPGPGWMICNGSSTHFSFAAAAAEMDFLKMSQCQGDLPNCPKFKNDCCPFNVHLNSLTRKFSVVREGENPGPGHLSVKGPMCCEDAAIFAGIPELGCTQLDLVSVPGTRVQLTEQGWRSLAGPVTVPANPPFVVPSLIGGDSHKPPVIAQNEDQEGWTLDDGDDDWIDTTEMEDEGASTDWEEEDGGSSTTGEETGGTTTIGGENDGNTKPPQPQEIDLSGTWIADRSDNPAYKYRMTIKRTKPYEWEGTWEITGPAASSADRYAVRVVADRPGEGSIQLPFSRHEMTYSANEIVANETYRRQ